MVSKNLSKMNQQSMSCSIPGSNPINCCISEPDKYSVISEMLPNYRILKITNPELSLIPVSMASVPKIDLTDILVPSRVVASTNIPQGSMTLPIDPASLIGKIDHQQLSVCVNAYGTFELDRKVKGVHNETPHWVRSIRFSDDCHSYNVQLKLQPAYRVYPNVARNGPLPKLILQAVRPIDVGQELFLWFSEDILAMLQVVFLNPSNIQGQKRYVCTRCLTAYEAPNPLKLHITLNCFKSPISFLWNRLSELMKDHNVSENTQDTFEFKLLSPDRGSDNHKKQKSALDLSLTNSTFNKNLQNLCKTKIEGSAFKPFKKEALQTSSPLNVIHDIPTFWPIDFEQNVVQFHQHLMQSQSLSHTQVSYSEDAQIESLVSSLGKAKQGHICLYCGKCYSRKYGLKIHIRTHTGYKPLKCKYCDRPFGDPSNLNKHVRLHAEGNTPYKCDLCGKILVRRRDLDRHLKSRHISDIHPGNNLIPDSSTNSTKISDVSEITEVSMNEVYPISYQEDQEDTFDGSCDVEIDENVEIDDNEVIEIIEEKDFKDIKTVIKEDIITIKE